MFRVTGLDAPLPAYWLWSVKYCFNPSLKPQNNGSLCCNYGDWYTGRWWVGYYIFGTARRAWACEGCGPAQSRPPSTKCNSPSTHGHCTILYYLIWHNNYFCTQVGSLRGTVVDVCLRTFSVLRLTCSWRMTIYLDKPSDVGQPTRPTQPFIL